MNTKKTSLFIAFFVMMVLGGVIKTDSSTAACDRECLTGFMTTYINAMLNHKPDSLPVADSVRFTEDSKEIKIGEGYWKDISGSVAWRLNVIDVRQGSVAALFVIKGSSSILYAVRLKIVDLKITQIETMVVKNSTEGMLFQPQNFKSPDDSLMTKMPKPELLNTRADMIEIASRYPEAMKKGTGTFNKNGLYFSKTAYRLENGQQMAGPDNIGTQNLPHLSGMVYKPALVDEEAGIVLLRMNFGPGSTFSGSNVLDVFEAFKVYHDTMHVVMAIMQQVPEGTPFGWEYDAVGTMRNAMIPERWKNREKTEQSGKGISLNLELPCDKIILDIYDIAGRLVHAKTVANVQKRTSLFLPIDMSALPPGHFIGCVRIEEGDRQGNPIVFPLNTIR
jgi:hypothetical protein